MIEPATNHKTQKFVKSQTHKVVDDYVTNNVTVKSLR